MSKFRGKSGLAMLLWVAAFISSPAFGQTNGDGLQQAEPQHKTGLPILRNADEKAWIAGFDYYAPQPGFNRENRDIDVETFHVMRAWHLADGWEFQLGGAFFRASGTRLTSTSPPVLERSDALGLTVGPVVRWNFLQAGRMRLFGNLGAGFDYTNNPFPAEGTKWDFFVRGGGGASFRVSSADWVEVGYWWTHISNDTGFGPGNPAWQGRGVSVSWRHSVFSKPPEQNGKGFPLLNRADEKAWVSEAEYFTPLSSNSNGLSANLNVRGYRVARAWHFADGLEFQLGGTAFPSPMAAGLGLLLRWNFVQKGRWRLFADGEAEGMKDGFFFVSVLQKNFTDAWNTFLRTGGGSSFRLAKSYWLELSYRWAHTLSGTTGEPAYPSWSGQGASIGLRYAFPTRRGSADASAKGMP